MKRWNPSAQEIMKMQSAFSWIPRVRVGSAIVQPRASEYRSDDPKYTGAIGSSISLPEFSPGGAKWVMWRGTTTLSQKDNPLLFYGPGMDADGRWWVLNSWSRKGLFDNKRWRIIDEYDDSGKYLSEPLIAPFWEETPPWKAATGEKDFLEQVQAVTIDIVLPAIAVAVGTAVGGVGGLAVAAIITATRKIAKGAPVSDALVESTKAQLPGLMKAGVFDKAIDIAKDSGLGDMMSYGSKLMTDTEKNAFDQAQTIARSLVSQTKSIEELKNIVPADKIAIIESAVKMGATPLEIADAIGGEATKLWMDKKLDENAGVPHLPLADMNRTRSPFGTSMDSLRSIKAIATQTVQLTPAEEAARRKVVSEEVARRKGIVSEKPTAEKNKSVIFGAIGSVALFAAGAPALAVAAPVLLGFYLASRVKTT